MPHKTLLCIALFALLSIISFSCTHNSEIIIEDYTSYTSSKEQYYEQRLFSANDFGSKAWRIPVITQLFNGNLLIVCDKRKISVDDLPNDIDVVCRISKDNGRTWSELITIAEGHGIDHGCGDPAVVQASNGDVICAYVRDYGTIESTVEKPMRSIISISKDSGFTWIEKDITKQIWGPQADKNRQKYTSSFFSSGNGLRLTRGLYAGRIMIVACLYSTKIIDNEKIGYIDNYVVYSDDNGKTWKVSEKAYEEGSEAKIVELVDGTLLMSVRQDDGVRGYVKSRDGGVTWEERGCWTDLNTTGCNGDIIRYSAIDEGDDENILLHSMPNYPGRYKVSVYISYDEGKTWHSPVCLFNDWSAYSSMTKLSDGTIGVFMEQYGYNTGSIELWYKNFSKEWLLSRRYPE